MKSLIYTLIALFSISGQLFAACQRYFVIETSRVVVTLDNTKHDRLGNSDEIEINLATSYEQLDSNDFFSEFFGNTLYKAKPDFMLGISKIDVPFYNQKVIFDKEIEYPLLHNKFLNVLVFENDVAVPIGSGSIEIPFYAVTGGNHDDLMFSDSLKIDDEIELQNDNQDKLKITITPALTQILTAEEITNKMRFLLNTKTKSYSDTKAINQKIRYLDDLIKGRVPHSCE